MSGNAAKRSRGGARQIAAASSSARSRSPPRPKRAPGGARQVDKQARATQRASQQESLADAHNKDPTEAFRAIVIETFLQNRLSGKKVAELVSKATKAGAKGSEDLASSGAAGSRPGNISRDFMRKLLKGKDVPAVYTASFPLWDPKEEKLVPTDLPILLPHELLARIIAQTGTSRYVDNMEPALQKQLDRACGKVGLCGDHGVIPIGLHGDGVPHQKHKSVECVSWNFPGDLGGERVLCVCLEKQFLCKCGCAGRHTTNPILDVIAWSFRCCFLGKSPKVRHDGSAWKPSDKARSQLGGQDLGARSLLVQIRGDWAWYKQVFAFPAWSNQQICWRCSAGSDSAPWRDCSASAAWRSARLSENQFWLRQESMGIEDRCPLFSLPGFSLNMITIDVLHCMDLGVTQDKKLI